MECIRLAYFAYCASDSCSIGRGIEKTWPHLLVTIIDVEFADAGAAPGNYNLDAVAISYAWGEFDRQAHLLGHDTEGRQIFITLGAEWNLVTFMSTLVNLSNRADAEVGCWIDQICMPQNQIEAVRQTLASIPSIYRRLEVIVLLPGSRCTCLTEHVDLIKTAMQYGSTEDANQVLFSALQESRHCMNMIGCSSWFNRAWTRQELIYSRSIRCCWTGAEPGMTAAPCVRVWHEPYKERGSKWMMKLENPSNLTPHSRLLYQRVYGDIYRLMQPRSSNSNAAIHRPNSGMTSSSLSLQEMLKSKLSAVTSNATAEIIATGHVFVAQANYRNEAAEAIRDYLSVDTEAGFADRSTVAVIHTLFFFAGDTIWNGNAEPRFLENTRQLEQFLDGLGRLRDSDRSSTQPRDYVNSIWVDCPGFKIPVNFREADVRDLLQDATDQMRQNHSSALLTSAPAGLFGVDYQSGLWHPAKYLQNIDITKTRHVYGVLLNPFKPVPVTREGHIPLRTTNSKAIPFSHSAFDFETQVCSLSSDAVFNIVAFVVKDWAEDIVTRWKPAQPVIEEFADSDRQKSGNGPRGSFTRGMIQQTTESWAAIVSKSMLAGNALTTSAELRGLNLPPPKSFDEKFGTNTRNAKFRSLLEKAAKTRNAVPMNEEGQSGWDASMQVDHEKIVYELVTDRLGLDPHTCRSANLRLMISPDPPCIGLTRDDVFELRESLGPTYIDDVKTVCIAKGTGKSNNVFYEVKRKHSGNPEFTVFGIWVPFVTTPWPDDMIFATVLEGTTDAFIV